MMSAATFLGILASTLYIKVQIDRAVKHQQEIEKRVNVLERTLKGCPLFDAQADGGTS